MALIQLEGIVKEFSKGDLLTTVLKGIDLTIEAGEFVAIMGPSGSGKSTLMYILGLLDRPTSGRYWLDGEDVAALDDDALSLRRNETLGFVFQSFYLIPFLSVLDNVLLPTTYATPKHLAKLAGHEGLEARAVRILEKLGMGERLLFRPDELSGGQKQRVAIARSLMNDPAIILADEPTGQLDQASGKAVMEILSSLNQEGKTIILITHDAKTAYYAKRRIILEDGRIREEG
ncbi:MAG: ABC transporter ATP-binding protein [Campylobacterales bacterium]